MDKKTLIVSLGIFLGLFGLIIFLPLDELLKPTPPAIVVGPLTTRVDSTFKQVDMSNISEEQLANDQMQVEISNAALFAKMNKQQELPAELLEAAYDDAPKQEGFFQYSTLTQSNIPFHELDGPDTTGMKVACFSMRQGEYANHLIFLYNSEKIIESLNTDLYHWVYSGCAEAIKSGQRLNREQYLMTFRALLPKTLEYEKSRTELTAELSKKP